MALVTFTGFPASGKSKRAQELKNALETRLQSPDHSGPKLEVLLISDEGLNISRSAYDGQFTSLRFHPRLLLHFKL